MYILESENIEILEDVLSECVSLLNIEESITLETIKVNVANTKYWIRLSCIHDSCDNQLLKNYIISLIQSPPEGSFARLTTNFYEEGYTYPPEA